MSLHQSGAKSRTAFLLLQSLSVGLLLLRWFLGFRNREGSTANLVVGLTH